MVEFSVSCISVKRLAGAVAAVVVRDPIISSSTRLSWERIELWSLGLPTTLESVADGWIKFKLFGG